MVQKKVVLLLTLVIGIWGIIGYKLYVHLSNQPENLKTNFRKIDKRLNASEQRKLSLAYADPFIPFKQRPLQKTNTISVKTRKLQTTQTSKPVKSLPKINLDNVAYTGYQFNISQKRPIATLKVKGYDWFVKEGDSIDSLMITAIYEDSLTIQFEREFFHIKRLKTKK